LGSGFPNELPTELCSPTCGEDASPSSQSMGNKMKRSSANTAPQWTPFIGRLYFDVFANFFRKDRVWLVSYFPSLHRSFGPDGFWSSSAISRPHSL